MIRRIIYEGPEYGRKEMTHATIREAQIVAKNSGIGYTVARLHDGYNQNKFYGYVVLDPQGIIQKNRRKEA